MNAFLFQSVPERFDLRKEIKPGEKDVWYATRYRSEMIPGDIVFLGWGEMSISEVYMEWGHIASKPYLKTGWDSHGVDVLYDVRFNKAILAKSLRSDPPLCHRKRLCGGEQWYYLQWLLLLTQLRCHTMTPTGNS